MNSVAGIFGAVMSTLVLATCSTGQDNDLHTVVREGRLDAVNRVIRENPEAINAKAKGGSTALHWAVVYGHKDVTELLLRSGAGVNIRTDNGSTPLHWAANKKQLDIAKVLVRNGADVRAHSKQGFTPLHWAAISDAHELSAYLIENGADVNAQAKDGITALHWAVQKHALKTLSSHRRPDLTKSVAVS